MNIWFALLLVVFGVYRIARMLALEDGPFALFSHWRGFIFEHFGNGWVNEGFNCPLCISFWLSIIPSAVLASDVLGFFMLWFGIAGMSSFLLMIEKR